MILKNSLNTVSLDEKKFSYISTQHPNTISKWTSLTFAFFVKIKKDYHHVYIILQMLWFVCLGINLGV